MDDPSSRRRRRRDTSASLIVGRVITAGLVAYGTYQLANWIWKNYINDDETEPDDHDGAERDRYAWSNSTTTATAAGGSSNGRRQKKLNSTSIRKRWKLRKERMSKCRPEVVKALEGFLPTMRQQIEDQTSTLEETQALKRLRAEKKATESRPVAVVGGADGVVVDENDMGRLVRQGEEDIWRIIQVQMVTRMIVTAYAHTILFLVLTVQVHLMGGKLFEEQINNKNDNNNSLFQQQHDSGANMFVSATTNMASTRGDDNSDETTNRDPSDRTSIYLATHRLVLVHTYDYFFERGLQSLITTVHRATQRVLADWNVMDREYLYMSRERLEEAVMTIRTLVEDDGMVVWGDDGTRSRRSRRHRHRPPSLRRSMMRFLIPRSALVDDECITPAIQDDTLASEVLDETWDLLESPVLLDAQQDCLNQTFDTMRDCCWGAIFQPALSKQQPIPSSSATAEGAESGAAAPIMAPSSSSTSQSSSCWTTKPLATVITNLKHTSNSFYVQGNHRGYGAEANMLVTAHGVEHTPSYYGRMEMLPSVLELADVSFN